MKEKKNKVAPKTKKKQMSSKDKLHEKGLDRPMHEGYETYKRRS